MSEAKGVDETQSNNDAKIPLLSLETNFNTQLTAPEACHLTNPSNLLSYLFPIKSPECCACSCSPFLSSYLPKHLIVRKRLPQQSTATCLSLVHHSCYPVALCCFLSTIGKLNCTLLAIRLPQKSKKIATQNKPCWQLSYYSSTHSAAASSTLP